MVESGSKGIAEPGSETPPTGAARVAVFLAALVVTGPVAFFLFALGLMVVPWVVLPVALGGTAVVAALVAAWASNVGRSSRADLWRVLGRTEAAAAVWLVLVPLLLRVAPFFAFATIPAWVTLAWVAGWASWRHRGPAGRGDVRLTALILVATVAVIVLTLWLSSLLGWVGP